MMHSVLRPAALLATALLLLGGCDVLDDPVIPLTINYRGEAAPPTFGHGLRPWPSGSQPVFQYPLNTDPHPPFL